jgi:CheY-like chemotaxis protein
MAIVNDPGASQGSRGSGLTAASFAGPDSHASRAISVLYVDESPRLLEIVCEYLETQGNMIVDLCLTVGEALDKMRYIDYDVVITDYNFEHGEGISLLEQARKAGKAVPFVYFVLFRSEMLEDEARQYDKVWFVEKLSPGSQSPFPNFYRAIVSAVGAFPENASLTGSPQPGENAVVRLP